MSAARHIWWRETRAAFTSPLGSGTLAGFLALAGWSFAEMLRRNEGGFAPAAAVWGLAVGPWLPVLAAAATMRLFAEERQAGTFETLLTAPVRCREVVLGKFAAALTTVLLGLLLAAVPALLLPRLAPAAGLPAAPMLAAAAMLALQAAAWTAIGTLAALATRQQAAAGILTVAAIGAPYALHAGLVAWAPPARLRLWAWPPLGDVSDAASGLLALAPPVLYLSVCWCALFLGVRLLEARDTRTR